MDKAQPREVWEREVLSDVTLTVESRIYLAENAQGQGGTKLSYAAVRVTDGTSLKNGMWHDLRM